MDNDLISRGDLIRALNEAQVEFDEYYKGLGKAKVITDNAPAVDIGKLILIVAMRSGKREMMLNALRPYGEWIEQKNYPFCYECNQCGTENTHKANFCEYCGAYMRGGAK